MWSFEEYLPRRIVSKRNDAKSNFRADGPPSVGSRLLISFCAASVEL
jgi:hypothetical protein